ncbi:hypothetical protein BRARA_B01039 [Brassica rapa]|uniref:Uncharacterized protein n=2 Tax=Brassica campestris TaxID=3711 RepID=M4DUQ9_BRACM|nr:uncharacterized protein LOC103851508 [Brassica rapa]XP_033141580.1 uncharacterized protein LOC103851508 [Brassica rapa]KAG5408930.1 hypothetical protein IGI04_005249 [Brassica rapa subsp. trilocularis]RID73915.1 hypothetical protein BRARA_B01039 [Brassica rapa]
MQSTTLSGNYGFPLCISRIAQQLSISKEMADHDRRRKGMKKRRRSEESMSHGEEEMVGVERFDELWIQQMRESEDARDLIALFQDLVSWSVSSHTAKAA